MLQDYQLRILDVHQKQEINLRNFLSGLSWVIIVVQFWGKCYGVLVIEAHWYTAITLEYNQFVDTIMHWFYLYQVDLAECVLLKQESKTMKLREGVGWQLVWLWVLEQLYPQQ